MNFDTKSTVNLGDASAKHQVTVFANLGCPFCRKWYLSNWQRLISGVQEHQLCAHLKFLNKPKLPLRNGNIANRFVDYQNPKTALMYIKAVFIHQRTLDTLSKDRVANYLKNNFKVAKSPVSQKTVDQIKTEAKANHVTSVPTIIFDGQGHSDSNYNLPDL